MGGRGAKSTTRKSLKKITLDKTNLKMRKLETAKAQSKPDFTPQKYKRTGVNPVQRKRENIQVLKGKNAKHSKPQQQSMFGDWIN